MAALSARRWPWTVCAGLLIMAAGAPAAAAPDPFALMKKSDKRHKLPVESLRGTMTLQRQGSAPRQRQLVMVTAQDDTKGDRMRLRFTGPANIAGTALLSIEGRRGGDDEQWLYLPAFRRTRRVGTAELGDRFVGSDFYFEDLKRRRVVDFSYRLLREEKVDGHPCYVIESKPKAPKVVKESPYGKSQAWLRKDNLFVVRARHFDRKGQPLKEVQVEGLVKVKGPAWRANKVTVVDVQERHRTVLTVAERKVDIALDDAFFSKHQLAQE